MVANAAENAVTRAAAPGLNDATAATHKPAQALTGDAQAQSVRGDRGSRRIPDTGGADAGECAPRTEELSRKHRPPGRLLTRPDGASELTLNLQPSESGSLVVRLTLTAGHLDGHLQVDNPQRARALRASFRASNRRWPARGLTSTAWRWPCAATDPPARRAGLGAQPPSDGRPQRTQRRW